MIGFFMNKINLSIKFSHIQNYWDPMIVGELNNQQVKLVKFKGEFDWHKHENEDELFMVVKGKFEMQFRTKTITIVENELIIVPKGIDHCPKSEDEVQVMLFEPVSTINTGNIISRRTRTSLKKI